MRIDSALRKRDFVYMRSGFRRIDDAGVRRCLNLLVRMTGLGCVLTALAAAAPPPSLPVPPIPPSHAPVQNLAPVPDPDVTAPVPAASLAPQFRVQDFRARSFDRSLGYSPGSRFSTSEDKRPIQTPGVEMQLPLQ